MDPIRNGQQQRRNQIAEMICRHHFLSVKVLSDHFAVTRQTIRKDLQAICEQGLARRRHGGAERLVPVKNQTYESRQILNSEAKHAIAAAVARLVPNGASLAFSIGTTPEIVARSLLNHRKLRIVTNNLNVAMAAAAAPDFEITVAGGRLRNDDRDIIGSGAEELFRSYKVDIGIFGVAGIDEDGSLLDFHEDEVRTRQTIMANCRSSFLVLDHTKFSRSAHVRGGFLPAVDKIFCDRQPPPHILELLAGSSTELIICPTEPTEPESTQE